jgi:mxaK protein
MAAGDMRRPAIICAALALMLGSMMLFDGYRIYDASRFNGELRAGQYARAGEHASLHGQLANAYALHRGGQFQKAVKLYGQVEEAADSTIRPVIMFNLATLYLQRAMASGRHGRDVSLPLIELAKESFRELLRIDSSDWDAKYNLELAIRLSPEAADEEVEETVTPERTPRAPRAPLGYGGLP